jgi:predicted  nucleic acid-binding Zn ribbon protein
MARRVMNMCTINVFSVEDNMLTTHFDMMPDEPTDATRALLERATDARLTVQEVRVVSDDMGARIVIADDRDRHVLYDMHVQRVYTVRRVNGKATYTIRHDHGYMSSPVRA